MLSTDYKRKMSHKESIERIYELTPQIKDYDAFMHIGARWLPYTMYFHDANFSSKTVNTDELGFRFSHLGDKRFSVAQLPKDRKVNLLVGGSTALGVGATEDKFTVASCLCDKTGEIWLNFSGRGYNATQELILYLIHHNKFSDIGKVIVLSGMNTLALEGIPDSLASDNGRYYYSFEFQHYMNLYNKDMENKKYSFKPEEESSGFINKIKSIFVPDNPADIIITDEDTLLSERIDRAAAETANALNHWKLLLKQYDASISFFLQPLAYWTRDYLTEDESEVFNAVDQCPNNFYRLFSRVLGKSVHKPFFDAIKLKVKDIDCYDMNTLLSLSPKIDQTLFVDRVHFNDAGNELLADLIIQQLSIKLTK